jgi:prepilin-type N-terminal cleavage/methylation domain-containing protein
MKPLRHAGGAGFSLVELMTTLIVIGILPAFAVARFAGRTGFESRGFYDSAQGVVRYAQKIAIAQLLKAARSRNPSSSGAARAHCRASRRG